MESLIKKQQINFLQMLLKITCLCKIVELKKNRKQFNFGGTFGSCYGEKLIIFNGLRETHIQCFFMFGRHYFASIACSCFSASKEIICAFCSHLQEHIIYHVIKVCIEVTDKSNLLFQVIPLKIFTTADITVQYKG